jgi:hypothetical protein
VQLFIRADKTNQSGNGITLTIDVDEGNPLCVVTMFNRLRRLNPTRFSPKNAQKCLFRTAQGAVLHKTAIQKLLKETSARFGFKPKDFTSHSLRAGGASAMYHNNFFSGRNSAKRAVDIGRMENLHPVKLRGGGRSDEAHVTPIRGPE